MLDEYGDRSGHNKSTEANEIIELTDNLYKKYISE